jgi:lipid II:glycine glycyltransferase (peptidoglycan interpeptide bridge formation enzyme)
MIWRRFEGTEREWDDLVERLGATTPFQLSAWAEFRESSGWRSLRLTNGGSTAAVQLLIKSTGPLHIAWAPGAPLGEVTYEELRNLALDTSRLLKSAVSYLRIADHHQYETKRSELLVSAGWSKCSNALGGTDTLVRPLHQGVQAVSDAYSSNWSRNLRRGIQREITAEVWSTPEAEIVAQLHRDVEQVKEQFHAEWRSDQESIQKVIDAFGERLIMVKAQDRDGGVLAVRAAIVIGANAFDFLAATSRDGRKNYASNVALDTLLTALTARSVTRYDFGGVDRANNKGVFDFKHGAGGMDFSYCGEYEIAVPRFAKSVVSKLLSLRLSA